MATIAVRLVEWRRAYHLTQLEAAELLQYSRSSYQAFERGRRVPPYRDMQRIHATLNAFERGAAAQQAGQGSGGEVAW